MAEVERKKSTSSDSELSDGWSLVDHSDTVPLMHQSRSSEPSPQGSESSRSVDSSTGLSSPASAGAASTVEVETSSDAESVDIIQEDGRLSDYGLHHHAVSMVSNIKPEEEKCSEGRMESVDKMRLGGGAGVSEPEVWSIISSNHQSNEWCRLLIFTSSLVALLLLLVSYGSLFFKEQTYGRSDGMILLPDEDLSSLISDLAIFKEENSRLKAELNMFKYEYGNNMKGEAEATVTTVSDEHATAEPEAVSADDVSTEDVLPQKQPTTSSSRTPQQPPTASVDTDKLSRLMDIESKLKTFAENVGLSNLIIFSHNMAENLRGIDVLMRHFHDAIDRRAFAERDGKKLRLEQKMAKLMTHVEQDLKKSLEKISKRISKFYSNSLDAFCRLNRGSNRVEGIDCSAFGKHQEYRKKKVSADEPSDDDRFQSDSDESEHDISLKDRSKRFVRFGGNMKYTMPRASPDEDHSPPLKLKHETETSYTNPDKTFTFDDYLYNSPMDRSVDDLSNKLGDGANFPTFSRSRDPKKKKKKKPSKQEIKKDSKISDRSGGIGLDKGSERPSGDGPKPTAHGSSGEAYKRTTAREGGGSRSKCSQNKNCAKNQRKQSERKISAAETKSFERYKSDDGDSRTLNIHNESLFGKTNGARRKKTSGQWYLDLGETRRQMRAVRRDTFNNGWLFDRALVRDWCRTNSDSSLCTSFGRACDYCA